MLIYLLLYADRCMDLLCNRTDTQEAPTVFGYRRKADRCAEFHRLISEGYELSGAISSGKITSEAALTLTLELLEQLGSEQFWSPSFASKQKEYRAELVRMGPESLPRLLTKKLSELQIHHNLVEHPEPVRPEAVVLAICFCAVVGGIISLVVLLIQNSGPAPY